MIELFVFRHGETDWNRDHRFQGHTDRPLNDLGIEQAQKLRERLSGINFDLLLCSDLERAKKTAEIVFQDVYIETKYGPELREIYAGELEGLTRKEVSFKYGEKFWEKWYSTDPADFDFRIPGGESKREHHERVLQFLQSNLDNNGDKKTVAVSTHGGCLRRLEEHCLGARAESRPIPNCAVYKFRYQNGALKFISEII